MADVSIELSGSDLRAVAGFAAACAQPALVIFARDHPGDRWPHAAVEAAQAFADGAPRGRRGGGRRIPAPVGVARIEQARVLAHPVVAGVLRRYPTAPSGGGRIGELLRQLDDEAGFLCRRAAAAAPANSGLVLTVVLTGEPVTRLRQADSLISVNDVEFARNAFGASRQSGCVGRAILLRHAQLSAACEIAGPCIKLAVNQDRNPALLAKQETWRLTCHARNIGDLTAPSLRSRSLSPLRLSALSRSPQLCPGKSHGRSK